MLPILLQSPVFIATENSNLRCLRLGEVDTFNYNRSMKHKKRFVQSLLLSVFALSANAKVDADQSVNELSLGITVSASGSVGSASGMHTWIPGNLGDTVKTGTLKDDTLITQDFAVSVDYLRKLTDNLYLNAGITQSRMKTKTTSVAFTGGYVWTPFPPFTIKGNTLNLGPSYRFNSLSNLTPYVGLNASYFFGKATDTNYPQQTINGYTFGNATQTGTYGVGGPETSVTCWGLNPNVGVFVNSGFFKGFGVSVRSQNLDCEGDSMRSFYRGYKVKLKNILYQIDYRIFF